MEKQTAIEWLVEQIFNEVDLKDSILKLAIQQAKAMEKEQIIQAYHKAALNEATYIVGGTSHVSAEQYYNETFKSE